jgi:hypothetical protein
MMATNADCGDAVPWQAAAAGEPGAFGELFDRHAAAVYNYLARRTADGTVQQGNITASFRTAPRSVVASSQEGSVTIRVPPSDSYAVQVLSDVGGTVVTVPRSARSPHLIRASTQGRAVTVTR